VVAIETPFDKDLAALSSKLAQTNLAWGDSKQQAKALESKDAALELSKTDGKGGPAPTAPAADRGAFSAKAPRIAAVDLLDDIRDGRVKLKDLKEEELPEELRKIKAEERQKYLDDLAKKRDEFKKEAIDLDKKRAEFITKKLAESKDKGKEGFDNQVLEILRKQAKKKGIDY
jgi:hypothetical protein